MVPNTATQKSEINVSQTQEQESRVVTTCASALPALFVRSLEVKQFRCFAQQRITFDKQMTIIEGPNGSGKTSLLEALHYLCYVRSFRTHLPKDLATFGSPTFYLAAELAINTPEETLSRKITIGFSGARRLVKIDQRAVNSYRDLMATFRVITITEDDLALVQGGPDARRAFLDQASLLVEPTAIELLRELREVAAQRNALLHQPSFNESQYRIWSKQLYTKSGRVQEQRLAIIAALNHELSLLNTHLCLAQDTIGITYTPKKSCLDDNWEKVLHLMEGERRLGRSLFGAHLDDLTITFNGVSAKHFASRGQQKLIVVLLKIAQMRSLVHTLGSAVFLLDDFLTDFDDQRASTLVELLSSLGQQCIFTSPHGGDRISKFLSEEKTGYVYLSL
jgi:DNA replication and repair protein RecF